MGYEAPKCEVFELEVESVILQTSNPESAGVGHEGFDRNEAIGWD